MVRAAIERSQEMLDYQRVLVAEGSEWEVDLARRGVLDESALEIDWMDEHAIALAEP